jgi:hypothetical protein
MSTFGYYPKIDYWLFMSNGSIAVLLALAVGTLAFIFIWEFRVLPPLCKIANGQVNSCPVSAAAFGAVMILFDHLRGSLIEPPR